MFMIWTCKNQRAQYGDAILFLRRPGKNTLKVSEKIITTQMKWGRNTDNWNVSPSKKTSVYKQKMLDKVKHIRMLFWQIILMLGSKNMFQ